MTRVASLSPKILCLLVLLFSPSDERNASALSTQQLSTSNGKALATLPSTTKASAGSPPFRISENDVATIANGGVAVLPNFVPESLVAKMRADARKLQASGAFRPDGLTNNALGGSTQQGFTRSGDRQTFRGNGSGSQQSWFRSDLGDLPTRLAFDDLLTDIRNQLAVDLDRPSLVQKDLAIDRQRHEITYNWYEPGAKLGRHLDEHHEETKGPKGWRYPSRRSVTWLVYLNDHWQASEGGALLCHPRSGHSGSASDIASTNPVVGGPIGSHEGNLQVGWMDDHTPVYLDAFRESGQTALYSCQPSPAGTSVASERVYWSPRDFDVPAQPIDFGRFLPQKVRPRFEQISTASKDPRFATGAPAASPTTPSAVATTSALATEDNALEVTPAGGTLVLFDSVTLPHSVLEVTGNRQRIAATGWFHEDSQFTFAA